MTDTRTEIDNYQDATQALHDRYHPRIMVFLQATAELLRQAGWYVTEPYDAESDEFEWRMTTGPVELTDETDDFDNLYLDIVVVLDESLDCDGTLDGVTLHIRITTWGGRIVGQCTPYNYTPECWVSVDDDDAVAERFGLILNEAMPQDLVDFIITEGLQ